MKRTRKGFTLVELLIVIVVIGILSAMMMLSSTEAVTSSKASNIVSNLRNLKTAALAFYTDSMDQLSEITNTANLMPHVKRYLNSGKDEAPEMINYTMEFATGTTNNNAKTSEWFLKCTITGTKAEKAQIKQKLTGRAKSVGLLKEASDGSDAYDGNADDVYYRVR